jgi:peptide/nickel transport system substrate-binding protein
MTFTRRGFLAAGMALIGPMLAGCQVTPSPGAVSGDAPASASSTTTTTAAAASSTTTTAAASGTRDAVVYGVASEPKLLNPLLANDGASIGVTQILFEPLVTTDANTGSPVAALADRWDQSPDGLTYTFHIRPNVTWSDGQPLTSEDALFTFDTLLDSRTQTPYRSRLEQVAHYDAPDPATFRVTLKALQCPFLVGTMTLPIVPKHVLGSSANINTDDFNFSRPIGTGPYTFKEWQQGDHLTLVANPTYWGGKPKIGQWIRRVTADSNVTTAQLKTGEIDYAAAQPEVLDDLRGQANLTIYSFPGPNINYIAYNLDRPLFQDKRVRQALTYALDRASIVKSLLLDEGQVLDSPLVAQSWAYNTNVPAFAYNPSMARQLLADAGWTPGPDGVLQKDGTPFRFAIITDAGTKVRASLLTIAQDQWSKIGIQAQPMLVEFAAFSDKFQKSHDFDAAAWGTNVPIDPDQSSTWSSKAFGSGENYVHYANPQVDTALEQARSAPGCSQAARKAFYDQFQALVAEDQPYTFLWSQKTDLAVNKRIQNFTPNLWSGAAGVVWGIKDWALE